MSELHTYSIGRGFVSGHGRNLLLIYIKNPTECMRSGCRLPNAVVSEAELCPGFLHLRQPTSVSFGEKGLWVVWYNSDLVRLRNKGEKWQDSNMCSVYGAGH